MRVAYVIHLTQNRGRAALKQAGGWRELVAVTSWSTFTGQSVSIPCHSQTRTKHADLVNLETFIY